MWPITLLIGHANVCRLDAVRASNGGYVVPPVWSRETHSDLGILVHTCVGGRDVGCKSFWVATLVSIILASGCARQPEEISDELLMARAYLGGEVGLTPDQIKRATMLLADRERNRAAAAATPATAASTQTAASAKSVAGFPSPPPDRQSDCSDPDSAFVRWIQSVQNRASSGGACLNAKGAYLINSEGAKKSRYCAQFYTGTQREESLQQAVEYDRVATQSQSTMSGTCG